MILRKLLIALLTGTYGLLFVGGIVSYTLLSEVPPAANWAGAVFLCLAYALVLLSASGRLIWWLLVAALVGFAAELVGLHTGLLFGHYVYLNKLGLQFFGAPLAIGAAWGALLAYAAGLSLLLPRYGGALLGALWMVVADLVIDPLASGPLGYWQWLENGSYFGVPFTNFVGWFVISYVLLLLVPRHIHIPRSYRLLGLSLVVFFGLLAITNPSTYGVAAISAALLVLDLLLARLLPRKRYPYSPFSNQLYSKFVHRTAIPCSAEQLFSWHTRADAFHDLQPSWPPMLVKAVPSSLAVGQRAELILLFGPWRIPWTSKIVSVSPPRSFVDEQSHGPWTYWRHEHNFLPHGEEQSIMEDLVEYAVPGGIVGEMLGAWVVELQLRHLFSYRHRVLLKQFQ